MGMVRWYILYIGVIRVDVNEVASRSHFLSSVIGEPRFVVSIEMPISCEAKSECPAATPSSLQFDETGNE